MKAMLRNWVSEWGIDVIGAALLVMCGDEGSQCCAMEVEDGWCVEQKDERGRREEEEGGRGKRKVGGEGRKTLTVTRRAWGGYLQRRMSHVGFIGYEGASSSAPFARKNQDLIEVGLPVPLPDLDPHCASAYPKTGDCCECLQLSASASDLKGGVSSELCLKGQSCSW